MLPILLNTAAETLQLNTAAEHCSCSSTVVWCSSCSCIPKLPLTATKKQVKLCQLLLFSPQIHSQFHHLVIDLTAGVGKGQPITTQLKQSSQLREMGGVGGSNFFQGNHRLVEGA